MRQFLWTLWLIGQQFVGAIGAGLVICLVLLAIIDGKDSSTSGWYHVAVIERFFEDPQIPPERESIHNPDVEHAAIYGALYRCHVGIWPSNLPLPAEFERTSYENAALVHSTRIREDRLRLQLKAEQEHDRLRRFQIRLLLLSAASAFLIALKTFVSDNNDVVPFKLLMRGAWLPISVAALLVPVIATVYSGIIAFDDDAKNTLRDARALAQLEQLHGRIASDITSDPFLCKLVEIDQQLSAATKSAGSSPPSPAVAAQSKDAHPIDLTYANECLVDRAQKVTAWVQRYEKILNDASQTLSQAGDLAKPGESHPAFAPNQEAVAKAFPGIKIAPDAAPAIDPCYLVFNVPSTDVHTRSIGVRDRETATTR